MSDLKQQLGVMDTRTSQMLFEEMDDFDAETLHHIRSANKSIASGPSLASTTGTTRYDLKYRNELRRMEKEKKEQNEVNTKKWTRIGT